MRKTLVAGVMSVGLVGAGFTGTALAGGDVWGKGSDTCVPSQGADCADVSHKWKVDADGRNLEGINLKRSKLHGASLQGTNLSGANLSRVVLKHADLDGSDLGGATLRRAKLHHASLRGVSADGANFNGATLNYVSVVGASMRGADFRRGKTAGAVITHSDFSSGSPANVTARADSNDNSDLSGHTWKDTEIEKSSFAGANLRNTTWDKSTVRYSNFKNADLRNAVFTNSTAVFGGDFTGANLSGVTFEESAFSSDSVLNNVNMSGATFRSLGGIDTRSGSFTNVDLSNATIEIGALNVKGRIGKINLDGAKWTPYSGPGGYGLSKNEYPVIVSVKNQTSGQNIGMELSTGDGDIYTGREFFGPGENGYIWGENPHRSLLGLGTTLIEGWADGLAVEITQGGWLTNGTITWMGHELEYNSGSKDSGSLEFTSGSRAYRIEAQYMAEETRFRVDLIVKDAG